MGFAQDEVKGPRAGTVLTAVRFLAVAALLAALCFEGYYIFSLRATIKRQTEDLRNISVQLQLLKSERESLNDELSSAKKQAGEKDDGDTSQR